MRKAFITIAFVIVFVVFCSCAHADDGYISLEKEEYSISAGWNTITITPATHNINLWLQYEWYSENEEIATVSNYGTVRGLSEGSTVLHCKGKDVNGNIYETSCVVNVVVPISSITVEKASVVLAINDKKSEDIPQEYLSFYQYIPNLTFFPENASCKELDWSSSNPSVATVSEDGVIESGDKTGSATITGKAKDGSWASVQIYVTVPQSFVSATTLRFTDSEPQLFACVAKSGSGAVSGITVTPAGVRRINERWEFKTTGDCFKLESVSQDTGSQKANSFDTDDGEKFLCYRVVPVKAGYGTIQYTYNGSTKFTVSVTVEQSAVQ